MGLLCYFLHNSKIATVLSRKTSFKVQQEPAIAEVEVSVVSVLLHQLKELRVQNLSVRWQVTSLGYTHGRKHKTTNQFVFVNFTWMSERILAKCESMAPPWGKFWFILFISSVKQLNAITSENTYTHTHTHETYHSIYTARTSNSLLDPKFHEPSSRITSRGASRSHMPWT